MFINIESIAVQTNREKEILEDDKNQGNCEFDDETQLDDDVESNDQLDVELELSDEDFKLDDIPEIEIDESEQLEMSLAIINEIIAIPSLSQSSSSRDEPDNEHARGLFTQTEQNNNNNFSNTQMEVKAAQDIFLKHQTDEDLNEFLGSPNDVDTSQIFKVPQSVVRSRKTSKSTSKYVKASLNDVLPNIMNYTTVAIAGESRKIGKSILAYEIVSEVLIQRPDNYVIFIDILNDYNPFKQTGIFKKRCKEANVKFPHNKLINHIKVLRISSNHGFHSLMNQLVLVIKQFNTCLVVIDNLTFFYQDSYGFKFFGRGITRKEFVKHYLKIFNAVAIETGVTILFTLPEHLLRENNSQDLIKRARNEEKMIYEHIQQKVDGKKSSSVHSKNIAKHLSNNSPGHKSDSEIDNIKPDMHEKLLDKTEIGAGISIFLSNFSQNRYKLTIYKSGEAGKNEKSEEEFFYCIKEDGFEFFEKISK